MASILKVDELRGIVSAGDITVTSEGGAATQSLQQGLAKAWVSLNGTGAVAIRDSFNTASITDIGTGTYSSTFSSAMSNASYYGGSHVIGLSNGDLVATGEATAPTTTAFRVGCRTTGNSQVDPEYAMTNIHGDLA